MEREIKFRCIFDNEIVEYLQFMNQGDKPNLNWMYSKDQESWYFKPIYAHSKLAQYTGMKDNNGNEVYEGDLLQLQDNVFNGEVGMENGCYKFINLGASSCLEDKIQKGYVVVGSIYKVSAHMVAESLKQ